MTITNLTDLKALPIRVQRKRTKGWKMPPNTVYVGRGSFWGNPYVVGKDGTLEECLRKYSDMVLPYTHKTGSMEQFYLSQANLSAMDSELKGKNLACWCPLDQKCHADLLLKWANPKEQALQHSGEVDGK